MNEPAHSRRDERGGAFVGVAEAGDGPVRAWRPKLFDDDGAQAILRMDLPLSFDDLVAALYATVVTDEDLTAADEDLRSLATVGVACTGLWGIRAQSDRIRREEADGIIESPDRLVRCRQRVREVFGATVPMVPSGQPGQVVA